MVSYALYLNLTLNFAEYCISLLALDPLAPLRHQLQHVGLRRRRRHRGREKERNRSISRLWSSIHFPLSWTIVFLLPLRLRLAMPFVLSAAA